MGSFSCVCSSNIITVCKQNPTKCNFSSDLSEHNSRQPSKCNFSFRYDGLLQLAVSDNIV